jgi:hypothetical protein
MQHPTAKQQIKEHGRELLLVKPIILPSAGAGMSVGRPSQHRPSQTRTRTRTSSTISLTPEEMVIRVTRSSVIASEPKLPVWMYLLFFVWCLFSAWIVVDVIAGSTFHDNDLALAALIILVASAIAASRLFLWIRDYRQRRRNARLF